jgi:4-oxalocrotonate tautomerase family enzyme
MPVVTIQLWEGRSPDAKRALVKAITDAMVEHAGADPSALHVILQEVPPENWGRAGVLGVDRGDTHGEPAPRISRLSHLLLQVKSLEDAERFYVQGLGFTVRKRDRFSDGRPLLVLAEGMGLTEGGPEPPGPVEHIAFRVRGISSYAERVARVGGRVLDGPAPSAYGISLYFEDPDGNKIEFHGD